MIRSSEYQRGFDDGYKQALLDALAKRSSSDLPMMGPGPHRRLDDAQRRLNDRKVRFMREAGRRLGVRLGRQSTWGEPFNAMVE